MKNVALFTRAWIEIDYLFRRFLSADVALFTRAWIEIASASAGVFSRRSPSSRGRGLKSLR